MRSCDRFGSSARPPRCARRVQPAVSSASAARFFSKSCIARVQGTAGSRDARKKTPGKTGPRGAKDADLSGSDWTPHDTRVRDAGAFERHPCRTKNSVVRRSRFAEQTGSECRPYRADIRFVSLHSFAAADSRRCRVRTCGGRIGEDCLRVKAGLNHLRRKFLRCAGNAKRCTAPSQSD